MPDGSIWNGLRRLRKDNTGYERHQTWCLRRNDGPGLHNVVISWLHGYAVASEFLL